MGLIQGAVHRFGQKMAIVVAGDQNADEWRGSGHGDLRGDEISGADPVPFIVTPPDVLAGLYQSEAGQDRERPEIREMMTADKTSHFPAGFTSGLLQYGIRFIEVFFFCREGSLIAVKPEPGKEGLDSVQFGMLVKAVP
jgi:hypothetical protein